jgi:hypothetical protein
MSVVKFDGNVKKTLITRKIKTTQIRSQCLISLAEYCILEVLRLKCLRGKTENFNARWASSSEKEY